jgi:3-methyladenine DNA glycosylase AlkD
MGEAAVDGLLRALEKAGSAQTRKIYLRHGATEPLFGVSFADLKAFVKRLGVDDALARGLWASGNYDARTLALKIADPARMTPKDLDRWLRESRSPLLGSYLAMLAAEGPHAAALQGAWLKSKDVAARATGWALVGQRAMRDEAAPDAGFAALLGRIGKTIQAAADVERKAMNGALIAIGCRSAKLRTAALAAAKRIGTVEVDPGDTACKVPDARVYLEKTWAHSTSKGFATPAAQERSREPQRLRC